MHFGDLPAEIPEEKLQALVEELSNGARKLGLYTNGIALNVDQDGEDATGDKKHMLIMQFQIGDVAFSPRVQDPEADEFDLEFKKIESGTLLEQIDDIRKKYEKE